MFELKACAVCFSTNLKLFIMDGGHLRHDYNTVSGLQITELNLDNLNCAVIDNEPTLWYIDPCTTHYEEVTFQSEGRKRITVFQTDHIPVVRYNILPNEDSSMIKKESYTKPVKKEHIITDTIDEDKPQKFDWNQNGINKVIIELNNDSQGHNDTFDSNNDAFDSNNDDILIDNDNQQSLNNVSQLTNKMIEVSLEPCIIEEYANAYPITKEEAQAAHETHKKLSTGKHQCQVCNKAFSNQKCLKVHLRMHDKHTRGSFLCDLCMYYYRTESLLKTHMTEKHMYKYVCRKCSEVTYKRTSAKQHYIKSHLLGHEGKPNWVSNRGGNQIKSEGGTRPVRKRTKLPDDYLKYTPISQEEQYKLIEDRKETRNYIDSLYKCGFCYRGFRVENTYNKHMKKHDQTYAGKYECDICKLCFQSVQKLSGHMYITHLFKLSCQMCSFVCYNKSLAQMHYRWHKNVTYDCPHCKRVFKKMTTRLTHIRISHPSTFICDLCGHGFVSETGIYYHKLIAHKNKELESNRTTVEDGDTAAEAVWEWTGEKSVGAAAGNSDKNAYEINSTEEKVKVATEDQGVSEKQSRFCAECDVLFVNEAAYITHLGSSSKHTNTNKSCQSRYVRKQNHADKSDVHNLGQITSNNCEVCGQFLVSDVQADKHYKSEHPGVDFHKRFMCEVCGFITKQYANLVLHFRKHTKEKPFKCAHCDRSFSNGSNRDRHAVTHSGEKRFQCQHCNRRFMHKVDCKSHIQHVHLKIPYPPRDRKNRKRRKEIEDSVVSVEGISTDTAPCPQSLLELPLNPRGDYLNAYMNYTDL
ncbi:zinc finger protein 27-like isoform X2 [Achroia grisella]|uniref:zinc finger protein 27-like isoform X2 n=1 Tax=Achroia grisella TaxID=688607 RepID=UPI0027D2CE62|nr:zinc finger protein 27-like isoform X2 [Achroia grisella]